MIKQIKPAIKELDKLRGQLGRVEELIADSGYFSQANVEACETAGMTPFIAVSREEHNQRLEDRLSKPEEMPTVSQE